MKMTRSREILVTLLQLVFSACTVVLLFSFVLNLTVGSQNYYGAHFPITTLSAECDAQLTQKFEKLSDESGFPVRVFEMVKTDMPTAQAVTNAIASAEAGEDGSLYSENLVDYFYHLCEDYAKGNHLDYRQSELKVTAKKAARIFSETVGVTGLYDAQQKSAALHRSVTLSQFLSFALMALSGVSIVILFTRKRLGYYRVLAALFGGALGALFASLGLYIIKPVQSLKIEPAVYTACFSEIADKCFSIVAMLSFAITAASLIAMIQIERHYQKSKDKVNIV